MFLMLMTAVMSSANEYITIFRDGNTGESKFHVVHSEVVENNRKAVELNVKDRKAWLVEDVTTGDVTLIIGEDAFTAPKAKDKEPVATISYFAKAYANVAAPKKKKNPLGSLGSGLLGVFTGGLGSNLFGSVMSGSLGSLSGKALTTTALGTIQGFAVREMTQSLGRATSYSAMAGEDEGFLIRETTKVDKTTLVETIYLRKKPVVAAEVPTPASPKSLTATEMFEKLTQFISSGADEKEGKSGS